MGEKRKAARRSKPAPITEPSEPPKKGRRGLLTPETQAAIVDAIASGAFDYVAAHAAGISERTFRFWMTWGAEAEEAEEAEEEGKEAPQRADSALYAEFYAAVRQARAQARLKAENRVYSEDPFKWLRYGPGRDRPGSPGWTDGDSGAMLEVTDGHRVIKTYWGRASDKPPARPDEEAAGNDISD